MAQMQRPAAVPRRAITAKAYDLGDMMPAPEEDIPAAELPKLSDNPTDEELNAYAAAHPGVRRVVNVFRGKIVEVTDNRSKPRT